MISCIVEYQIDPSKLAQFEEYAKKWIEALTRLGGIHHGYFLPSEGASDRALCIFSFESLAAYEAYRQKAATDPECLRILAQEKHDHDQALRPVVLPATVAHHDAVDHVAIGEALDARFRRRPLDCGLRTNAPFNKCGCIKVVRQPCLK